MFSRRSAVLLALWSYFVVFLLCAPFAFTQATVLPPLRIEPRPSRVLLQNATQAFTVVRPVFRGRGSGTADPFVDPVAWSSSDTNVVTVDPLGVATAIGPGTAVITVRALNGPAHGTAVVTVPSSALSLVTVSPVSATVPAGLSQQYQAIGTFADASNMDLTQFAAWSSSDSTIAAISNEFGSQGHVLALKQGAPVTISASVNGKTGNAVLTVNPPIPQQIFISPLSSVINVAQTLQYSATARMSDGTQQPVAGAVWNSSDLTVAGVDANGLATAAGVGQTSITAQAFSLTTNTASLAVNLPLTLVSGPSPFPAGCDQVQGEMRQRSYENGEVEPRLAIDPLDPHHLVGIYQQDRWSGGGAHGVVVTVSRDGGATWSQSIPAFSRCAGGNASNGGDYDRSSDPWISFAPDGTVYISAGPFDRFDSRESWAVGRSTDGGSTWGPTTIINFESSEFVLDDKDTIAADPLDAHDAYLVWDRQTFADPDQNIVISGPTWFSRTIDGGQTWEPSRSIFDPDPGFSTINNEVVVLPDGTLLCFFVLYNSTSSFNGFVRSNDKGVTWTAPVLFDSVQDIGVTDVKTRLPVREGVGQYTVDPNSGALYVVTMDARFSGGQRNGILFYKSTDGGQTWTSPVQINQAPNVQAFAPTVAVAADGSIAVNYYDFRQDNSDPNVLLTNYWQVVSHDGGQTWQEFPLAGPFDLRTAPFTSLGYMVTDYEGIVGLGDSFVSFFVQANSGNTANPTDVFAISSPPLGAAGAAPRNFNNGHVEINLHPLTPPQLHREEAEPAALELPPPRLF